MRQIILLLLFISCFSLTGCKQPMIAPIIFSDPNIEPFDRPSSLDAPNRFRIFYATDRQAKISKQGITSYTHKRSDLLTVGYTDLRFGPDGAWPRMLAGVRNLPGGELYLPRFFDAHPYGPMQIQMLDDHRPDVWFRQDTPAADKLIDELNEQLDHSKDREITLYFHGFNNSFEEAAMVTAEYDLYTGGLGPFILYSWPSYDSLWEYSHDRDSVRYTSSNARRLVELLSRRIRETDDAKRLRASKINLIAHSTGAEIVGSVLRELGLMTPRMDPNERLKHWNIGTVLLISPDISTDVARERLLKEDVWGMFEQMVVYSSKGDRALWWASAFLYQVARIGSIEEDQFSKADRKWLSRADNITVVDIDDQPYSGFIRHTHHRNSGAVASDIILSLRSSLKPEQRGLVRDEGRVLWHFAKDYHTRVTDAAKKVYSGDGSVADLGNTDNEVNAP